MEATGKQMQAMGAVFKQLMSLETRDRALGKGRGPSVQNDTGSLQHGGAKGCRM